MINCNILLKWSVSTCLTTMAVSQTAIAQTNHISPDIYIEKAEDFEEPTIQSWIDETLSILNSDEFASNLLSLQSAYPEVWLSEYQNTRTVPQLFEILKAQDNTQSDEAYLRTGIIMKGTSQKDPSEDDGYKGNDFASIGPRSWFKSLPLKMRLGRVHLDRYLTGNVVEKSCAINTMAHEISHTISLSSTKLQSYILDIPAGKAPEGVPTASYFVGTVAQCTYLQKNSRIKNEDLQKCLDLFVSQPFPSKRCDDYPDGTEL